MNYREIKAWEDFATKEIEDAISDMEDSLQEKAQQKWKGQKIKFHDPFTYPSSCGESFKEIEAPVERVRVSYYTGRDSGCYLDIVFMVLVRNPNNGRMDEIEIRHPIFD
jgi:hypothetical protein